MTMCRLCNDITKPSEAQLNDMATHLDVPFELLQGTLKDTSYKPSESSDLLTTKRVL